MPKIYSSRELIKMVEADGWHWVETTGSHYHFRHPAKSGKVTIPHPRKDVPTGTANSIIRQAGLNRTKQG